MGNRVKAIVQLLVVVLVAFTGASGALAEQKTAGDGFMATAGEYRFGIGDTIEVQVWNEQNLSRTQRVRLDGRISLALIGDLEAAGKSPQELAAQIEKSYSDSVAAPSVTVILSQSSQRYYVIGQVKQPGEFALDSHLTVLQALARSGGFLEWAKTSNIIVVRRDGKGEHFLSFDYDAVTKKKDISQLLHLAPGDTIIVP